MLISSGSTIAYSFLGTKSSPSCLFEKWNNSKQFLNKLTHYFYLHLTETFQQTTYMFIGTLQSGLGVMAIHHSQMIPPLSSLCNINSICFSEFLNLFHTVDNVQWILSFVLLWTSYNVNRPSIVDLNDNSRKVGRKKIQDINLFLI